ncbi:hypothetical protein ACGFY3_45945 [Streptomyces mirabilis]|uniref:hypothetical protein n=1 Tax=Streptomyces mirabilis TaxID=68239 RepID=UPI003715A477
MLVLTVSTGAFMVALAFANDSLRQWLTPLALAAAAGFVLVGLWMLGRSALGVLAEREARRLLNESQSQPTTARNLLGPGGHLLLLGCFVFVVWLTWYGLKNVLDAYLTRGSLGPTEAPDIVIVLSGASAIVTAVSLAVSRIFRAVGMKNKESGAGAQSEANGRAAEIRAQAEGEAVIIRAKAELRRAEAEFLRAQKGLDPLLPANSNPDGPAAIGPAPSPNGNSGSPAVPPGGSAPDSP